MNVRSRGLTLLEVLVATSLLSVLLVGASELLLTGQSAYAMSTGQAMVRGEAQRALDACVKDLRGAAAWSFATASGTVPGAAGSTITELTSWDQTSGTLSFSFGPRSNVLFARALDAQVVPTSSPPYVILDFEPRGLGVMTQDVGSNGTTFAGRMDDDQLKARVLLRTRVANDRVVFERVFAPVADPPVDSPPIPESVLVLADLGPATVPLGATPGGISFETVAPGVVRVKASARTFVDQRGKRSLLPVEISTDVALTALAPPR